MAQSIETDPDLASGGIVNALSSTANLRKRVPSVKPS
jgi:hypothetical protein